MADISTPSYPEKLIFPYPIILNRALNFLRLSTIPDLVYSRHGNADNVQPSPEGCFMCCLYGRGKCNAQYVSSRRLRGHLTPPPSSCPAGYKRML